MSRVGFVAIGRNEGERLRRCLASLKKTRAPIVYVDSGSSDGSVELARQMGADVVELDMSIPFNAARARNSGMEQLRKLHPEIDLVHFIDADCSLADGWLEAAEAELDRKPECAVICGNRRELHPESSIYNRFCNLEWAGSAGEIQTCGGDALMRIDAFEQVGGFDPSVPAGEEPELCQRLRAKGWKIIRLPDDMTWHDAAMTHFGQWWRRQFRCGYNGLDVARRFNSQQFRKVVRSARIWVLGSLGLAIVLGMLGDWRRGWMGALAGIFFVAAILFLQAFRIGRRKGGISFGFMVLLSKVAEISGQAEYYLDRRRGKIGRLIEYKRRPVNAMNSSLNLVEPAER